MATIDLSKAKTSFRMDDLNLVQFHSVHGAPSSTQWSYLTPAGHRVVVRGVNMSFDAGGRPNAGTATSIEIDVGNDGTSDLVVTGVGVEANSVTLAALHGGPAGFWRLLLDGNDVILGPELAQGAPLYGSFVHFADGVVAKTGASTGGSDIVSAGDRSTSFSGDVMNVGSPTVGAPTADYHGGDDELLGPLTEEHHGMTGDAWRVYGGSRLTGGNDSFFIQSTNATSSVEGDAGDVVGEVIGGNDYIAAGKDFQGTAGRRRPRGAPGQPRRRRRRHDQRRRHGRVHRRRRVQAEGRPARRRQRQDQRRRRQRHHRRRCLRGQVRTRSPPAATTSSTPAAATTRSMATPAPALPATSASAATTGSTAKAATTGCTATAGPTPSMAARSPTRSTAATATTGSRAGRTTTPSTATPATTSSTAAAAPISWAA